MKFSGYGVTQGCLGADQVETILAEALEGMGLAGQRVLVIIPDGTRSMPLALFFRLLCKHLLGRARALDFMVALGTHPPMSEAALLRHVGITPEEKAGPYAAVNLFNHAWDDPRALAEVGAFSAEEVAAASGGLLAQGAVVRANRRALDYDCLLICGPVFPHEVVGFSGGSKYLFPGIAGPEIIALTHWLGALLTSSRIIGTKHTPVRELIERAAACIPRAQHALCAVVAEGEVDGLFGGAVQTAWEAAADLSAQRHIRWCARPYRQVLSVLPEMYDEMWVGAKGMYKLEPVVADGGEVILYAPHIRRFSQVHGRVIEQVGYHVRDYFTAQWERFKDYPWGVLAHSTHLRGAGTYENGVERARIQVTLATAIPEAACRAVNLGYRDPAGIRPQEWAGREEEGLLLVPHAGEILYRVREPGGRESADDADARR